jgi:DegV family protein with EDD domain
MKKTAVLVDSTCTLAEELMRQYDIGVVPAIINFQGKEFRDGIDISSSEVYEIIRRREDLPTTSTPSLGDFLDGYERMGKTAEAVLCLTVTGLQSHTFGTAVSARDMAREKLPDLRVEVLDTRSVAGAHGFIALEAARAAGKGASLGEVIDTATAMMSRVNFLAVLDTLYFLQRTGRVGKAAALIGSLLNVKPILEHSPSVGETAPVGRARTKTKAIEQMLEIMSERVGKSKVHANVHHAGALEEGWRLQEEIGSKFDCLELWLTEFTPVMGVHTGPGLVAVAFYAE